MQTQGGTPFISPLEPSGETDHRALHARLNVLSVILVSLFLICMAVFAYRATLPPRSSKAKSPSTQNTQQTNSPREVADNN